MIDGSTGDKVFETQSGARKLRANRMKLRRLLLEGLDVVYDRRVIGYRLDEHGGGVVALCEGGFEHRGTILVGCDGNNSAGKTTILHLDNQS